MLPTKQPRVKEDFTYCPKQLPFIQQGQRILGRAGRTNTEKIYIYIHL